MELDGRKITNRRGPGSSFPKARRPGAGCMTEDSIDPSLLSDTGSKVSIQIISAALPPRMEGIGDYSAWLAAELARVADVTVLTTHAREHDPIPGVRIVPVFSVGKRSSVWRIEGAVAAENPDLLLLQYNPFSYGRRGLNPWLPLAMRRLVRRCPQTRFAIMAHETFVPAENWKWALMTVWQRWQMWMLGRSAEVILFPTESQMRRLRRWFPRKQMGYLPVGSNVPLVATPYHEARARLGIRNGTVVLGLFGTAHPSRMLSRARSAAEAVLQAGAQVLVLYIGPHGSAVRLALGDLPLVAEGPHEPEEVSRRLAAVDIYLAPFEDGVSTRRGSLMAGIQHGLACVGTLGPATDALLESMNHRAFILVEVGAAREFDASVVRLLGDRGCREELGLNARRLYEEQFSWRIIASRLLEILGIRQR